MIDPRDQKIGQLVRYRAPHGETQDGVIIGMNSVYIFVRYGNDIGSKATRPEDLELR